MLSLVIHFFLVSSFKIEEVNKKLFEELDIEGSLSLLENIQTKESHAYQYLLKKIFTNDTKTAACHLYASKGSEYFNLAIAYNAHFTTDFELEHSEIAKYYRNIATKVYKAYLNDKSKFKTKMLFKDLQTHLSALQLVEQLVNLIIAGDAKAEEEFLSYLHSGRIQPADYKDILELLAKNGNGSAMGILGRMYFEGWGVEKCEDTAMHYFTEGVRIKDAVCFNEMGDVFREKKDYAQAKKYYEEGSRRGNIEADYNLYRMCRDVYNAEDKGFIYLSIAANKGYLPALFDSGLRLERLQNFRNAIMYYSPMCEYSEFVTSLQQKAESYFVEGRYDQAIIPLLFCAELGSTNSMYNILYVTSHVKELEVCDKNMLTYRMTKRLTDMGYKTHVVRLGDCYFYGIGVDRSYTDAFSFYLNASLENDPEGIYSLAYLYEHGLGVEKDLHKSLKYITMINVVNGDLYLLVWYVSMKLVLKIVVGYVFRRSTILVGVIVGMCGFAWLKSYSKKIKKD